MEEGIHQLKYIYCWVMDVMFTLFRKHPGNPFPWPSERWVLFLTNCSHCCFGGGCIGYRCRCCRSGWWPECCSLGSIVWWLPVFSISPFAFLICMSNPLLVVIAPVVSIVELFECGGVTLSTESSLRMPGVIGTVLLSSWCVRGCFPLNVPENRSCQLDVRVLDSLEFYGKYDYAALIIWLLSPSLTKYLDIVVIEGLGHE